AGGNFEEPVTQATLAVVGCFLGLSRSRSDARRYPAIDPLISWSKYLDRFFEHGTDTTRHRIEIVRKASRVVFAADEIGKKMSVVGEEGISRDDMVTFLKGEFYDAVFLQQNAFDKVDTATDQARQTEQIELIEKVIDAELSFDSHDAARRFFLTLQDKFIQWNYTAPDAPEYADRKAALVKILREHSHG
ncbi:MAG TPA: V-type ATP synthase subunit A, partial [bacterium]|nr:V-type ATP synthase subunit A [bacterium]